MNKKSCIVCDIDGVYIDSTPWRNYLPEINTPKEWQIFQDKCEECCTPNTRFINYLKELISYTKAELIFLTARGDTKELRDITVKQIQEYSDNYFTVGNNCSLLMRPKDNYGKDNEVKEEILVKNILPYYSVLQVIDDNIDNVNMFLKYNLNVHWYMELLE